VTAFLDTNVLVRHLTGEPRTQAARATRYLQSADELLLPDLILAEVCYVLESFYETPREQVAETLRAVLAFPAVRVLDVGLLQRAIEVYELHRLDFADAYLVASAERTGVGVVASFDRAIDRVGTVHREELLRREREGATLRSAEHPAEPSHPGGR
jgi:predicted nucleic acid-binding protein